MATSTSVIPAPLHPVRQLARWAAEHCPQNGIVLDIGPVSTPPATFGPYCAGVLGLSEATPTMPSSATAHSTRGIG